MALGALHEFGDDAAWRRLTDTGEQMLRELASQRLTPLATMIEDFSGLAQLLDRLRDRQFSGKPLIRVSEVSL